MDWEKMYERFRYTMTVIWMNTFGLVFEIIKILTANKEIIDPSVKEVNEEELEKDIAKLMILVGAICLGVYWIWVASKLLLIISLILIGLGIGGKIAQGIKTFLNEIFG